MTTYTGTIVRTRIAAAIATFAWFLSVSASAEEIPATDNSLSAAISGGKLLLNLRPRYEYVDLEARAKHANALTARTLLGWETRPWHGVSVTAQAINVTHLTDNINDDPAHASPYPIVADPDNSDINQLFLDYTAWQKTRLRVGKQSIKLDNVRFIGNVEFRQVMQVFSGVTIENTSVSNLHLYAGHLERVKNIFAQQRRADIDILHAIYRWSAGDSITGYTYLQNDPNQASAAAGVTDLSNRTVGIRADGAHAFGTQFKLLYTAEYATQGDYAGGDERIDARYIHLGAGPRWGDWYVRADFELLSSNDGVYAFQTPLGTNHLFQGWADQFLTTPRQGLRDAYLSAGGKIGAATLYAEYHDFRADEGSIKFGREFDFSVAYPFSKRCSAKLEYADFHERDELAGSVRKPDVAKFWVTLLYNY